MVLSVRNSGPALGDEGREPIPSHFLAEIIIAPRARLLPGERGAPLTWPG